MQHAGCWILAVPHSEIEPGPPVLGEWILTTGPPGKSHLALLILPNTTSSIKELSGHIVIEVDGNMESLLHDSLRIEIQYTIF